MQGDCGLVAVQRHRAGLFRALMDQVREKIRKAIWMYHDVHEVTRGASRSRTFDDNRFVSTDVAEIYQPKRRTGQYLLR